MAATASVDLAVEHYALVEKCARSLMRRWRLPSRYFDELVSAGNEAIVHASRAAYPEIADVSSWLSGCIYYGCIDWLRHQYGRPGSTKHDAHLRMLSLNRLFDVDDGEISEDSLWLAIPDVTSEAGDAGLVLREILACCPNDRYREAVLMSAAGATCAAIGRKFGVTESRVSQMLSVVRQRFDHGCVEPERREEWLWDCDTSPDGSWR